MATKKWMQDNSTSGGNSLTVDLASPPYQSYDEIKDKTGIFRVEPNIFPPTTSFNEEAVILNIKFPSGPVSLGISLNPDKQKGLPNTNLYVMKADGWELVK